MEDNSDIQQDSLSNLQSKMSSGQPLKLQFSGKPTSTRKQAEEALGYTKDSKDNLNSALDNLVDN